MGPLLRRGRPLSPADEDDDDGDPLGLQLSEDKTVRRRQTTIQKLTDLYGDNLTDLTLTSVKKLSSLAAKNAKMLQKQLLFSTQRNLGSYGSSTESSPEMQQNAVAACRDAMKLFSVWDAHVIKTERRWQQAPPQRLAADAWDDDDDGDDDVDDVDFAAVMAGLGRAGAARGGGQRLGGVGGGSISTRPSFAAGLASAAGSRAGSMKHAGSESRRISSMSVMSHGARSTSGAHGGGASRTPSGVGAAAPSRSASLAGGRHPSSIGGSHSGRAGANRTSRGGNGAHGRAGRTSTAGGAAAAAEVPPTSPFESYTGKGTPGGPTSPSAAQGAGVNGGGSSSGGLAKPRPKVPELALHGAGLGSAAQHGGGRPPSSRLAFASTLVADPQSPGASGGSGSGGSGGGLPALGGVPQTPTSDRRRPLSVRQLSKQDTRRMAQAMEAALHEENQAPLIAHARAHSLASMGSPVSTPRAKTSRTDGSGSHNAQSPSPGGFRADSPRSLIGSRGHGGLPASPPSHTRHLHLLPDIVGDALGDGANDAFANLAAMPPSSPRQMADALPPHLRPRSRDRVGSPRSPRGGDFTSSLGATSPSMEEAFETAVSMSNKVLSTQPTALPTLSEEHEHNHGLAESLPVTAPRLRSGGRSGSLQRTMSDLIRAGLLAPPQSYDSPRAILVGGYLVAPYTGVFQRSTAARQEAASKFVERVMESNPAGFVEDVAASEVAAYREAAERGRAVLNVTQNLPCDLIVSTALRGSLQELHFRRPFFLSAPHAAPPGALSSEPVLSLGLRAQRRPRPQPDGATGDGTADAYDDGGSGWGAQLQHPLQSVSSHVPGGHLSSRAWQPEMSIFAPRAVESDARALNDSEAVQERQLMVDWRRLTAKDSFRTWLATSDPNIRSGSANMEQVLEALHKMLLGYWPTLRAVFMFYSAVGVDGGEDHQHDLQAAERQFLPTLSLPQWNLLLTDCRLVDMITPRTGQSFFTLTCGGGHAAGAQQQPEVQDKLMRFEFYEAVVRMASTRYLKTGIVPGTAEALRTLVKQDILPNLLPAALYDPRPWREARLYSEEVDAVLRDAGPVLSALYSCSCASAGTRYLKLDQWLELCQMHGLIGDHVGVTAHDVALVFGWSQLLVVDELQRRQRTASMDLLDMAEGFARLADMINPPNLTEVETVLAGMGIMSQEELSSVMAHHPYHVYYSFAELQTEAFCLRQRNPTAVVSSPQRPLANKISALFDYFFTALCVSWDVPDVDRLIAKLQQVTHMVQSMAQARTKQPR